MRSFFSFVQDFIEFRYNLTRQSFRFISNECRTKRIHDWHTIVKLVSLALGPLKFLLPAIMRCCVFRKHATIKGER